MFDYCPPEDVSRPALESLERRLLLDGTGFFADSGQGLEDAPLSEDVALGDLDGDGDLDAIVANNNAADRIWLGDGEGGFVDSGQRLGSFHWDSDAVALGDLDGDGDLDAFVAQDDWTGPWYNPPDTVWINDGGQFTNTQQLGHLKSHDVALGDLDGDGDLDAFTGHDSTPSFGTNRVWINDGAGGFDDSGQNLGRTWAHTCYGVALGDFDGDGDLDAYAANGWGGADTVWLNDGQAGFVGSGQDLGRFDSYGAAVGDVDGDGDLDVCVVGEVNRVLLGDGRGGFTDVGRRLGASTAGDVALADFDGDGDLDAFLAVGGAARQAGPNQVWINDGQGCFTHNGQALGEAESTAAALGDLDGDGDVDALVSNILAPHTVWLNLRGDADLEIGKTDAAVTATPGKPLAYTMTVTNHGPADVGGAIVVDTFPAQLADVTWAAAGTPGTAFTGRGTGDIHDVVDLPAGGSIVYVAIGTLDAQAAGTITNVAHVTAPEGVFEWPLVNNTAADTDTVAWAGTGGSGVFLEGDPVPGTPMPDGRDVALGDLDGDGDLDAFFANDGEADRVWLGDGEGGLIDSGQRLGDGESYAVALGDVDGDGDLDAVVVGDDSAVWLNDGQGRFSELAGEHPHEPFGPVDAISIALGDVDGDGDPDAVIGADEDEATVWLNDGSGRFAFGGELPGPRVQARAIALGDLDGDGDLDAFIANRDADDRSAPDQVLLGDGRGNFTDSGQLLSTADSYDVALGDVDGDGDLDAMVAAGALRLLLNDGQGGFTDSGQGPGVTWTLAVALGDFDGDGDLDALTGAGAWSGGEPNTLWLGDGEGGFTDSGGPVGSEPTLTVAAGDLNGDGTADAVALNVWRADTVWLGDGQGGLIDTGQRLGTKRTADVAVGDLDGDGDVDAFLANGNRVPNRVLLGDGQGGFTDTGQELGSMLTYGAALADVDGDGDLDAITAGESRLWINDGQGVFADGGQQLGYAGAVALGDLDGDGDADAILGGAPADPSTVWLNDGAGRFEDSRQGLSEAVIGIAAGDLDGDGDLDAVLAVAYGANTVWLNQGTGQFNDTGQRLGEMSGPAVALGDFDGDGDSDLLADGRLWLNDGAGRFADSGQRLGGWQDVAVGDLDGDGDLDAFLANVDGGDDDDAVTNRVWLGDGEGNLIDGGRDIGSAYAVGLALGDVDGDGDLDAFVGNLDQADAVWLNQDDAPPAVTNVLVGGSEWDRAFLDCLAAEGLGEGGYAIPVGSADQLEELPWIGIDRITIVFDEAVSVAEADLSVRGVNVASYSFSAFAHDPATFTATWTLARPVAADKLLLELSDDVADAAGIALDGEWADAVSTYRSGNGAPGGAFRFRLNVLPGDVDQSGRVGSSDVVKLRRRSNTAAGDPDYSWFDDIDGSGDIRAGDTIKVRRLSNTELPAGEPVAPPAAPSAPSIDADLIAAALRAARRGGGDRELLSPLSTDVLSLAEIVPLAL